MQAEAGRSLKDILDPSKYAYAGYSMGGGGSLYAALADPSASAILPLAPFSGGNNYTGLAPPMLVVSCSQDDSFANNSQHSDVFYKEVQSPKAQVYVSGDHGCVATRGEEETVGRYVILWMKLYVQEDNRYRKSFCDGGGGALSLQSTVCKPSDFEESDACSASYSCYVVFFCVILSALMVLL
jgi:dienelactone hydrolase